VIRPWYTAAVANGKVSWTSVYTFITSSGIEASGVTISGPWYQSGTTTLLGVAAVDIDYTNLDPILQQYTSATASLAYLVETSTYTLVSVSTG
jgi:hypothetical protein